MFPILLMLSLRATTFDQHPDSLLARAREAGGTAAVSINLEMPVIPIESLRRDSPLIVRGFVRSVTTRLATDESIVLTQYELVPTRIYKGSLPAQRQPGLSSGLSLVHPGGTVEVDGLHLATTVDMFPAGEVLRTGEEVILFLIPSESEANAFRLQGGPFGAFRIKNGNVAPFTREAATRRGDRPERIDQFEQRLNAPLRK